MRAIRRRRVDRWLLLLGGLLVFGMASCGANVGDAEHVASQWVGASVENRRADAHVTEVIDYDFDDNAKRGIFRDIPDLDPDAEITVESPTAAADLLVSVESDATNLRIGDPAITNNGLHRYRIDYPLDLRAGDGSFYWDAVGTSWEVGKQRSEIHLAGRWEWTGVECVSGSTGSTTPCTDVEQVEPGHLVVQVGHLAPDEGVTVRVVPGARLDAVPALDPPTGLPVDPAAGILDTAGIAAVSAIVAMLLVSLVFRLAGRDRVASGGLGGPADVAWASGSEERRVDVTKLAELATTEFAPPEGITAPQGGILLEERVTNDHRTAWLLQAAIDGYVELEERRPHIALKRLGRTGGETADLLQGVFGASDEILLGTYQPGFASMYQKLALRLTAWLQASALWDRAADRRSRRARSAGAIALVPAAILMIIGAIRASRTGTDGLRLVAAGAVIFGLGWGALTRGWELRVRTREGTALWLRVESFRRFLAASEARHAEEAAARGLLLEYTAWAVALGEADHWAESIKASNLPPDEVELSYATFAPRLVSEASSSLIDPSRSSSSSSSSSSSGSSFSSSSSSSVGGGSGGGGGGSW